MNKYFKVSNIIIALVLVAIILGVAVRSRDNDRTQTDYVAKTDISSLEKSVKTDPNNKADLLNLGQAYIKASKFAEASLRNA